ncbi:ferritin-like domain-containing protein [Halosolutus gelatinilyticus]|uniref:YciE/YciF ferroxidase family protein n=1 Tax=Halosolutus gelatinilyticus TaxID=2931975 RepID=UPI001FF51155|nr:DUF892 family protein [Halosolutus gelatinilyticus]
MPSPEIRNFSDQFVHDLAAVYDMELKLVDALDDLSRRAANDNLSKGFAIHQTETKTQVRRVEEAFAALDREPERRANPIVDGLLADTEEFDDRARSAGPRNLHYLTAATMTERIEITSYEGLLLTADRAGLGDDATAPLEANLEQEEKTLRKLEGLAAGTGRKRGWKTILGR